MKQILVYGSLRRGKQAHKYLLNNQARFLGEVTLPGFDMLKLGWFPGIVPNPENKEGILGELYEVAPEYWDNLIEQLDYYEGYFPENQSPSLFVRTEIDINDVPTTVYLWNGARKADIIEQVPHGDWMRV